jgi:hypothetical protein
MFGTQLQNLHVFLSLSITVFLVVLGGLSTYLSTITKKVWIFFDQIL